MGERLLRECRSWLVSLKTRDVHDGKDAVYFYDNEVSTGDIFLSRIAKGDQAPVTGTCSISFLC